MRALTEFEIKHIEILTEKSVEITLIEPTATGLEKSIMDATGSVRNYLKRKSIHDFDSQGQGPENKIQIKSYLVGNNSITDSIASLYRPNTKKGDPRVWFKGLGTYANANDILAIIAFRRELYVLNLTSLDLVQLIESDSNNPVKELIEEIKQYALLFKNNFDLEVLDSELPAESSMDRINAIIFGLENVYKNKS